MKSKKTQNVLPDKKIYDSLWWEVAFFLILLGYPNVILCLSVLASYAIIERNDIKRQAVEYGFAEQYKNHYGEKEWKWKINQK